MPPRKQVQTLAEVTRNLGEALLTSAGKPTVDNYKPHQKQYEFHSSQARLRLYIGGNRSGKTVGGIIEDILWLIGKHPFRETPKPPVRGRIVSVDFIDGIDGIIIPQILQWLPTSYLKSGSWTTAYDKQGRMLTLENGSTVQFMSYEQATEKFAGTSLHFIHFDEEPPEDIYTECLLRTIDVGGCMWITMTPVEGMTWIFDKIYEPGITGQRESTDVIVVDMRDNPYLSTTEIEYLVGELDADELEARVHGKFVQLGGLIYKHFDPAIHVVEFDPRQIPRDGVVVASLDAGFNNPTAWLWHYITPDGDLVTFKEHYASGLVVEQHAIRVNQINKELGRIPDFYIGDPSIRNTDQLLGTSVQQEYIKYGIPVTLGNNDVRAGIIRVAGYMRMRANGSPAWHVSRECTALISELLKYRWKTYANKRLQGQNNLMEEPHKHNDHAADSLRYFIMSRPSLGDEYVGRNTAALSINNSIGGRAFDPMVEQVDPLPFRGPPQRSDFNTDQSGFVVIDDEFGSEW